MRRGPIDKDRAGPMRRGPSGERGPLQRGPLETQATLYSRESGGAGRRPRLTIWFKAARFLPITRSGSFRGELTAISTLRQESMRRASARRLYLRVRAGFGRGASRPGGNPGGAGRPGK